MTAGHTPGPWRYDYESGYCGEIIAANGSSVCSFDDEPNKADAKLIAAAPELLAVLQSILERTKESGYLFKDSRELYAAKAAITKATGGTP